MFYKCTISALALIFLLQNLSFVYVRSLHRQTTKSPAFSDQVHADAAAFDKSQSETLHNQAQQNLELWNCVNLFMGASITPSLTYRSEYWRLFTCFFLHENFLHFAINVLIILSYSQTLKIDEKQVALLFVPAVILGHLLGAIFYPDFLKIGASVLSFVLCGLSIGSQQKFYSQETAMNAALVFFLLFSTSSGSLDHSAHVFGLAYGLLFALCHRYRFERLFWLATIVTLIGFSFVFSQLPDIPENKFAVELDYGCGFVYESLTGASGIEGSKF